jgi:heme oxygenase (mycobilin-producing)
MQENKEKNFVAINFINCKPHYVERFEELFATRAKAIDRLPGFINMEVLKPQENGDSYLIVSHWENEENFKAWTKSPEFIEGHKRGFEDIKLAKEKGEEPPMSSSFKTYDVIAR